MTKISKAVDAIVEPAFLTGKVKGSKVQKEICRLTIQYSRQLSKNSRPKKVLDLASYIYNKVIALKKVAAQKDPRPATGMMVVLDNKKHLGRCLNYADVTVTYHATWACNIGEQFPYRREGDDYYLENFYKGYVTDPQKYAASGRGNFLLQHGNTCIEIKDGTGYETPGGYHKQYLTATFPYPNVQTWYKQASDGLKISYVENGTYKERTIERNIAPDIEIDISAYLTSTASTGTITLTGTKNGQYVLEDPKVVRMVHWNHVAILQVMYEQRSHFEATDDSTENFWPFAVGTFVKSYTTVSLFKLILIDTTTGTVVEEDCLSSHSSWFDLYSENITAGYTDIQLDKETGHLLLIKSGASPSTTTLNIDYFKTDEYDNHTWNDEHTEETITTEVCDYLSSQLIYKDNNSDNPTYGERVFYPVSDSSQSATISYSSYTLYSAKVDTVSLGLKDLVSKYAPSGSITSLEGATVSGGFRGMVFTQGPEAPFKIFVKAHKVGYANANHDFVYTPSSETEEGPDLWLRSVVCLGMFEMLDLAGTSYYSVPTTDLGMYNALSPDKYTVDRPSTIIAFNKIYPVTKMFGLRSLWPDLEGNNGKPDEWVDLEDDFGRTDLPTTKPYYTALVETRFGEDGTSIGNSKNRSFVPVWMAFDITISAVGETDSLRNDPDNFIAFTNAGDRTLFILATGVEYVTGRYINDSYATLWETNSDAHTSFAIFLSYAKYRDGINDNFLNLQPFPDGRFPDGTYMFNTKFHYSGDTTYTGFTFLSCFRPFEQVLYFYITKQYVVNKYDIATEALLSSDLKLYTTLGIIKGTEEFIYAPNPIYPDEWVCVSAWMPAGPSAVVEQDGALHLAGLGHRIYEKERAELTANAIP